MLNNLPFVSIIIPCRNEKKFIGKCLDSIIAQDYSKERLEILVVDGMSNDKTRDILKDYGKKYSFIKPLDNQKKVTPVAMNVGIKAAQGEYILILSSHSKIDQSFIKRNIENIIKYAVDCVGGVMKTLPANDTVLAKSIAFTLSHPFGVGNAYFRIGAKEPKYVDTVPFGCYKKEVFQRIGLFDKDLLPERIDMAKMISPGAFPIFVNQKKADHKGSALPCNTCRSAGGLSPHNTSDIFYKKLGILP